MKLKHIALLLIVSSCAPTIKNFDKYQKQFITKTEFMPSKESLEGKPAKVVVFDLDENGNQVATQAQLGSSIANSVETVLSKNRLAALVDRKAAAKLQKEIALAETNKTGSYKGPQIADYAISGTISNAGFTSKYNKGSTQFNPKTGRSTSNPPRFIYSSEVSGNLKIYELPSLAVVEVIELNGEKSRTENVQKKGGLSFGGILEIGGEEAKGADRDDSLVRKAGEDAVEEATVDLKNTLAKKGYILEKRVFEKKTIFKITLGSLDGLKHGDKFEIFGQYETENPITNQNEVERRVIGSGTVTDKIDPKTAWVVVDENDSVEKVRLGDSIKMKYKKSTFSSVVRAAKNIADKQ